MAGNDTTTWVDDLKAFIEIALDYAAQAALNSLTQPKAPKADNGQVPLKQAVPPCTILVGGFSRVAGALSYWKATDRYHGAVYLLNDGRVEFDADPCYVNDDRVTLDGDPFNTALFTNDGWVTGVINTAGAANDGRYDDQKIRINLRRGQGTETAYQHMVEFFGPSASYDVHDYTASFRGDGTASAMAFHQAPTDTAFFRQAFPSGRPTESFVCKGVFYDWRDVTQDRDDESTWQPSSNPVVNLVHLEWFRWGRSWDRCIAPVLSDLTAEADYCDGQVALDAGGTEDRYRVAGWYYSDTQRSDIRQKILDAMDGFYTTDGRGRLIIKAGGYVEPTFVITADYIEGFSWSRGQDPASAVNELSITFTSPANDYTEQNCDPWIAGDGGKADNLDLAWVPSFTQARRLAKRKMARLNPVRRGQIRTGPYGLNGLGERFIRVRNPRRPSMADVVCEVTNAEFDPMTGQFVFDVIQADIEIDAWDPSTEEGAPVPVPARP